MNTDKEFIEFISKYKNLAFKIANKIIVQNPQYHDEIYAAALFGLWEASKKKEVIGSPVSFYGMIIRNHILYALRPVKPISPWFKSKINDCEMHNPIFVSMSIHEIDSVIINEMNSVLGFNTTIEDAIISTEEKLEREHKVRQAIDKLPDHQKQIINFMFFNNMESKEIASEINCSYQNINKIKQTAFKNIRKHYSN